MTKVEFTGTRNQTDVKLPHLFVPKEVKVDYNSNYDNNLFDNDIFIFNLEDSDYKEVEYIIKGLKTLNLPNKKTLILISSIMTWARTPPKIKEEKENFEENIDLDLGDNLESEDEEFVELEEENEELTDDKDNPLNNNIDGLNDDNQGKEKVLYFKDKDYVLRVPSEKYYKFKMLETLAMSASNINPNVITYVVCPGFVYGNGEDVFFEYFKMAWLENPPSLPVIAEGKNTIPTIHAKDIVTLIKRIIEDSPKQKYILAVDRTKNKSLKKIIESISKSTGSGTVVKTFENFTSLPAFEGLSTDLKFQTSKVFSDERRDEEEDDEFNARKFKWHCEFGIAENLETLRKEFTSSNKLTPIKIVITGPPASGKTFLSERLSTFYNIPVYNVKNLIQMAVSLPDTDVLGEEIKNKIEELKDRMIEEAEQSNPTDNSGKIKGDSGTPDDVDADDSETIRRSKLNPRLPDEFIAKILKRFLSFNICKNRGYILDGYPRFYQDSLLTFYDTDIEKAEDEPDRFKRNDEIFPTSVIKLDCSNNEFLKNRIKNNPELADSTSHYTNESMTRRINLYREKNESTKGELSLADFFKENQIEILEINCDISASLDDDHDQILEKSKIFLEKNCKINNFQTHDSKELILNKESWSSRIKNEQNSYLKEIKEY